MIIIDYKDTRPIYEQVAGKFKALILKGALQADEQMPSVRSLAMELSINPNTIQKAYSVLEQEGYIYPVKGRGNFVSGNSELKVKKQEAFFVSLEGLVKKGKELDVKREIFLQKAEEYFKEGSYDRN